VRIFTCLLFDPSQVITEVRAEIEALVASHLAAKRLTR
jgi:hypothetical protein